MSRIKDLSGMKFGKLTVSSEYEIKNKNVYWKVICECGNKKSVQRRHLTSGNTKSCGCYMKERASKTFTTHGGSYDRLYRIAQSILSRCNKPTNIHYKHYGGRGIECRLGSTSGDVYLSLLKIPGYFDGAQIDRIDNDGHYELGNLRWVTRSENIQNSTKCKSPEHYETHSVLRADFKNTCKARGWDFDDFIEAFDDWHIFPGGTKQRRYVYKLK